MEKVIVSVSSLMLILIALGLPAASRSGPDPQELSQAQFVAMLQSNLLTNVRVYYPAEFGQVDGVPAMLHQVRGTFYVTDTGNQMLAGKGTKELPFIAKVNLTSELEDKVLSIPGASAVSPNSVVQEVRSWFRRFTR